MNGVVQVISVHLAGGDVDLAGQLAADPAPVLLEIGGQVRMLPPVGRDAFVDRARLRIEERLEIAVLPHGAKDRLPAIPVLARVAVGTQGALVFQLLLHRRADDTLGVALARQRHAKKPRVPVPGVLPVVDVDDLEAVKVHRIGARRKSSAEVVGMEDLQRERLPSPRGPARENPRPGLADRAKVRFDVWDQLSQDHLTVRSVVGRIDRVGIVVVRRRMLERDVEHLRKPVGEPGFREFLPSPRPLFLPFGCTGGQLDTLAEATGRPCREMSLLVVDRIRDALVLLIVARQEDRRPDEDGLSPELREKRALKPYALDVLAVRRDLDRRDLLRERQAHGSPAAGVQVHLPDLAVEVAGGNLKDLSLPLIGMELDSVPVRPVKRRVDVEHPLDEVIAGRDVRQPRDRISERRAADDGPCPRREIRDVLAEERRRTVLASFLAELQAGLGLSFPRNHDENAPVGGLAADARRERKLELQRRARRIARPRRGGCRRGSDHSQQNRKDEPNPQGDARIVYRGSASDLGPPFAVIPRSARDEGSACPPRGGQILRFAQDDNSGYERAAGSGVFREAMKTWATMRSIAASRTRTQRISVSSSSRLFPAEWTSKQPQSTAWPRARLKAIAAMKTRSRRPTTVAASRRQTPRMSAKPARNSTQGITRASALTAKPGTAR